MSIVRHNMDRGARWRCPACMNTFNADKLLRGRNPFDQEQEVIGCPNCKTVHGHPFAYAGDTWTTDKD